LFFVMILSLGLCSSFAWLETLVVTARGMCKRHKIPATHSQIVGVLCVLLFIAGLPFCTRGGIGLLDVVDHFVGAWFLLFSCLVESIMFLVDFGWDRYANAIITATRGNANTPDGRELHGYWRWTVRYIVPVVTTFLLVSQFISALISPYGDYSVGLLACGWVVFLALVLTTLSTHYDTSPGKWTKEDEENSARRKEQRDAAAAAETNNDC
jgi:NSS family neurotransmitter:Na+ symporter